ncbi:MAG: hypothetical protein VW443_02905 [Pseudomonadales bacterium]
MSNFLNFAGNQGTTFKNHGTGGGTSFTLDTAATTNSVLLTVGAVLQEPGVDYTVSGTTITTTTSVTAGIEVFSWIIHKPGTAPTIQDNSVTGGKIALTSQAEGDLMYCNASGDWVRLAKGTAGQVLKQNSGLTAPEWGALSAASEHGTNTTLSGTSADFTGITAGTTWIDLMLIDLSNNSTSAATIVQLGDAGGIETTGYDSQTRANDTSTSGFLINGAGHTSYTVTGIFKFRLKNPATNEWIMYGGGTRTTTDSDATDSWGHKQLSGELTQFRITNESGASFDAGSANILYGGS